VALAAVLALDPPVLVLDEVMSQLDQAGKKRVAAALKRLRDMGKAVIAVEHNLEAVSFADRLLVMEKGELLSCGRTAELLADREFMEARGLIYDPPGL
jgi:energy-coupling factor transport system ATP-binding protein